MKPGINVVLILIKLENHGSNIYNKPIIHT